MKRPPPILDPPRRKRALSEEEQALWESATKQTRPLRKKHRAAGPHAASPKTDVHTATEVVVQPKSRSPATAPAPAKSIVPPLAPLGRREKTQLSRGRKEIEARLDLHGMTQARAHRALSGFLHRAHGDGLTFVLVITGKGKIGADSERGVLRRQVPQWLSQPEFRSVVVGFEEAHIGHGGAGALYVRIRRTRA
jgi:DNA-nicking Smr family endonuclease